ncbi:MAG: aminotransferase class III-fold pyridoxal phosphate-dependent enzyme [Bdellovibrionaceae bacterium]|nr:aminotransferase class III-fold pyridoxal phosphate-dependent enzyme [Pseudobdellovibrionaceae bacterium]
MSSKLVGHEIAASTRIHSLINDLVQEVARLEQPIAEIREPDPARADHAKSALAEIGKYRGRPLVYPYLGTGAGHGPYVELEDGSVKMDLINGIGVHILGHSHPKVIAASVRGALSDVVMQGNLEPNHEYSLMGKRLVEVASKNSRLKYAWIATCGTMANENALKMARQKHSPARFVVAMKNAFAGRSTMMAEVTDNPAYKQGLPEYNEVLRIPWYDASEGARSTERTLALFKEHVAKHEKNISCLVFEPMLGEGGYRSAPRDFFVPLLEFCKEKKIAVWADEVQTFMRTGELFAFETLGIGSYIDICTVAKTLQCGATLYTEEYNPQPGLVAGTFAGGSAPLAAGLAILEEMVNGGYMGPNGKIQSIHKDFVGMLNRLNETTCKGLLREAGGMGLMIAVTPLDGGKDTVTQLLHTLFKNGVIAFSCGRDPYRLRFLVPAVMTSKDIAVAEKVIEKSILEMA